MWPDASRRRLSLAHEGVQPEHIRSKYAYSRLSSRTYKQALCVHNQTGSSHCVRYAVHIVLDMANALFKSIATGPEIALIPRSVATLGPFRECSCKSISRDLVVDDRRRSSSHRSLGSLGH